MSKRPSPNRQPTRTGDLPKYSAIRQQLERLQGGALPSPCIKGKADCCDRSVGLTREDAALLLRALAHGKISAEVRDKAARNLADKASDRCPFLDENRACLIYEHRPLICLAWGVGGRPKPEATPKLIQLKQVQQATGVEQSVSADDLVAYVCPSCRDELARLKPQYPLSAIEAITAAWLAMHAEDQTGTQLTNFVKNHVRRSR
jgi:Fe-S-cluster containining protein